MVTMDLTFRPAGVEGNSFYEMYIWSILGGASSHHFDLYKNDDIIIIIGTIFITIILLNILIAYLSNVFSRLEMIQNINSIKEKSSLILDLEVILYFFKYVVRGKKMKNEYLQNYQDQRHELLVTTSLHDIKVRFH
jgi:hypothetical protein